MEKISFRRMDGELSVEIFSLKNQPGSYAFLLWEAGENKVVMNERGNFINNDDDIYELPVPVESNNGRIIDFIVTLVTPKGAKRYHLEVIVSQNGKPIGIVADKGTAASSTVTSEIMIQLEMEKEL